MPGSSERRYQKHGNSDYSRIDRQDHGADLQHCRHVSDLAFYLGSIVTDFRNGRLETAENRFDVGYCVFQRLDPSFHIGIVRAAAAAVNPRWTRRNLNLSPGFDVVEINHRLLAE